MDYEIHIQDKELMTDPLILHFAERNSISLNWMGGDDKTKAIVGSELPFSLEAYGGADAMYDQYFTSNEKKWLVTKRISETQEIVWQGYLLPESYSEPWQNQLFYVDFSAVDGLGLLKGKELSEDFYSEEKNVIEIIAACLNLTKLPFDIYFSPAIQHHLNKEWHNLYFDTRKYFDEDKLPSAYDILKDIVFSARCQLYQSQERWYIVGINKIHLPTVDFYKYNISGEYLGKVSVTKNIKKAEWNPTPVITMVPAFKRVEVTHDRDKIEFPVDVVKEQDIEWKDAAGVIHEIYPEHWNYSAEYKPIMKAPDYYLELPGINQGLPDSAKTISLREKLYVLKGWGVKLELSFELVTTRYLSSTERNDLIEDGTWEKAIFFHIIYNDKVVAGNFESVEGTAIKVIPKFNTDLTAAVKYEFTANITAYLDVKLFAPHGLFADHKIKAVKLTGLDIIRDTKEKEKIYVEDIDPLSSQIREITLEISDDVSGTSKCFYPEKQRELSNTERFVVEVPVLYGFTQNEKHYTIVSLQDANLIDQFQDSVFYLNPFETLKNIKVIYNLDGGEQMAIETEFPITSGVLSVYVAKFKEPQIPRTEWLKWTDAVYNIEQKPYDQVVAEIESKLFAEPHLRIEGSIAGPVKFNDLIEFTYKGEKKYFVPTNVEWKPDENESQVTLVEGVYAGESLGNIPPFVYAGPDINIVEDEFQAQITEAVATDPNGYIELVQWVITPAGPVFSDANTLNPLITNLTEDSYTGILTVTDNQGAQTSDSMRIARVKEYELFLNLIDSSSEAPDAAPGTMLYQKREYQMEVIPELPPEETITFSFETILEILNPKPRTPEKYASISVRKNDSFVFADKLTSELLETRLEKASTINFIHSDDIKIIIENQMDINMEASGQKVYSKINFSDAVFRVQSAEISNLPVFRIVEINQ